MNAPYIPMFFMPGVLPLPVLPGDPFYAQAAMMNGIMPDSYFDRSSGPARLEGSTNQCRSLLGSDAKAYTMYCANPLFDEQPVKAPGKHATHAKHAKPLPTLADSTISFKNGVSYDFAKHGGKLVIPATLRTLLASEPGVAFTVQRMVTAGGPQVQISFFRESTSVTSSPRTGGAGPTPGGSPAGVPQPSMGTLVLDFGLNVGATIVLDRVLVMGGVPEKLRAPVMLSTNYLASLISSRSLSAANLGIAHVPLFTGFRFLSSEFLDFVGVSKGGTANSLVSTGMALTPFILASRFPALQSAFASAAGAGMTTGRLAPGLAGGSGFLGGCSQAIGAAGAVLLADYVGSLALNAAIADNPDKKLKNFMWDLSNRSAGGFSGWLMGHLPTVTKLIQGGAAVVSGNRGNFNDYLDERANEAIDSSKEFGETMENNLVRFSGTAMNSLDMNGLEPHELYALGLLPDNGYFTDQDRGRFEAILAKDPDGKRKALDHFWTAWRKSTENRIAEVYQDVSPVTLHDREWNEFTSSESQMVKDAYNLLSYTAPYASKAQKIRTLVDEDGEINDPDAFKAYMMEIIPPRLDEFATSLKPALLQIAMESLSVYPSADPNQPVDISIDWWKFESKLGERFRSDAEAIGTFYNLAALDRLTGSPKAAAAQELAGLVDKYGRVKDMAALRRLLLPVLQEHVMKKAGEIDAAMKAQGLTNMAIDPATDNWAVSLDTGRLTPGQMYFIDNPDTKKMMAEYEMLLSLYKMFDPDSSNR